MPPVDADRGESLLRLLAYAVGVGAPTPPAVADVGASGSGRGPLRRWEFERRGGVLCINLMQGTGGGAVVSRRRGEWIRLSDAVARWYAGLRGMGDREVAPGVGGNGKENVSNIVNVRFERGVRFGCPLLPTSCNTTVTGGV